MSRTRLDALSWHLERQFGAKIPQCNNCGSHDLWQDYVRASWHCNDCRYEITSDVIRMVPADENARNPDEEHKPEGRWLRQMQREARRV